MQVQVRGQGGSKGPGPSVESLAAGGALAIGMLFCGCTVFPWGGGGIWSLVTGISAVPWLGRAWGVGKGAGRDSGDWRQ